MALSKDEILTGLAKIVNDETGVAPQEVQLDKSFAEDLDIDSLSMMSICTFAEEEFDVQIPDETLQSLVTVADAVSFIEAAQN